MIFVENILNLTIPLGQENLIGIVMVKMNDQPIGR